MLLYDWLRRLGDGSKYQQSLLTTLSALLPVCEDLTVKQRHLPKGKSLSLTISCSMILGNSEYLADSSILSILVDKMHLGNILFNIKAHLF